MEGVIMPGVKITKELHAQVRETLKTNGIMTTARLHKLSPQSVSRIRRGGRSYNGYKQELADDHVSFRELFEDMPVPPATTTLVKKSLLQRIGLRR